MNDSQTVTMHPTANLDEKKVGEPDTPPPEYSEKAEEVSYSDKCGFQEIEAVAAALPLLIRGENPPEYKIDIDLPSKEINGCDSILPTVTGDSDPWALTDLPDSSGTKQWSELTICEKFKSIFVDRFGKAFGLLALLYFFICSLDFLSSAFRLLGGKLAGEAFSSSELLQNPVAGLMIGILATVLVQSSSTSTSIVVTMVASGIMDVKQAIPIIMGANTGTSVTNTIVSMAQSGNKEEFRRAFGGATVHDMFNWLAVLVLLPLEVATGYLFHLTSWIVKSYDLQGNAGANRDLLKTITKPFTKLFIQLDKKVLEGHAMKKPEYADMSLIKKYCAYKEVIVEENITEYVNVTDQAGPILVNVTELVNVTKKVPTEECSFLFHDTGMSDNLVGVFLLVISLTLLCSCLILMVKLLHSIFQGQIAQVIKKTMNADLPGKCSFLTGYLAILIGAGMTILVQSSSVFTSALTPLVGIGVIKLERMYPLTLGSNIGTTATGLLAALAAPSDKLEPALQIALCHLFFNLSGILLFYPIPAMRLPIKLAKMMGNTTAEYRWFAIFYLLVAFFIIPGLVFALSIAGTVYLLVVLFIVGAVLAFVVTVNILQSKCPQCLPSMLKNWEFLPECLHSLDPLDRVFRKIMYICRGFCPSRCCAPTKDTDSSSSVVENVPRASEDSRAISEAYEWTSPKSSLSSDYVSAATSIGYKIPIEHRQSGTQTDDLGTWSSLRGIHPSDL